jgi:hypothetical protein
MVSQQRPEQHLSIDLVCLGPALASGCRDRRGIHYALCLPGEHIDWLEKPVLAMRGAWEGWYYCEDRLLGISKPVRRPAPCALAPGLPDHSSKVSLRRLVASQRLRQPLLWPRPDRPPDPHGEGPVTARAVRLALAAIIGSLVGCQAPIALARPGASETRQGYWRYQAPQKQDPVNADPDALSRPVIPALAELASWTPPKIMKLIEQQRDYAATGSPSMPWLISGGFRTSRGARHGPLPG